MDFSILHPLKSPSDTDAISQHFLAIIESSQDAIISKDLNGNIISWNKGAERIFGYMAQEIIGKNISILIPADRQDEEPAIINRLVHGERIEQYDTMRRRKDGTLVNVSLTISPIKDSIGKIIGASKIVKDMPSEDKLIKERNQLRVLIDNLPDYIYFKDLQSKFVDANKATLRIMKCQNVIDLIGKTDFDFYPLQFAKKFFEDEARIFSTGEPKIDIEETVLNENKQIRTLLTSKVPLKDQGGKIIGLVGIGRDITEQREAREILERDNETLEKMVEERTRKLMEVQAEYDKAKRLSDIGTLAAIVGHELRNPLEVIKLALHSLKKNQILAENKHFITIEQKLREGHRIIDNLLNYSRIKSPTYESVNLLNLLNECLNLPLEGDQITVEKKYEVGENFMVELDPYQVKEVFINIFNNAFQAIKGPNGKIEVMVQPSGDQHVCVVFKDNGTGIDEKNLNKIFMPFFTSKSRGTGLGLAICKELVSLHEGKIEVQSRKGEGTAFRVILPLRQPR